MMSPKKITRLAIAVGVASVIALAISLAGGGSIWWPVAGFGLSLGLILVSFMRGAYLTAQQRANMVDLLNDCYYGNSSEEGRRLGD